MKNTSPISIHLGFCRSTKKRNLRPFLLVYTVDGNRRPSRIRSVNFSEPYSRPHQRIRYCPQFANLAPNAAPSLYRGRQSRISGQSAQTALCLDSDRTQRPAACSAADLPLSAAGTNRAASRSGDRCADLSRTCAGRSQVRTGNSRICLIRNYSRYLCRDRDRTVSGRLNALRSECHSYFFVTLPASETFIRYRLRMI